MQTVLPLTDVHHGGAGRDVDDGGGEVAVGAESTTRMQMTKLEVFGGEEGRTDASNHQHSLLTLLFECGRR